MMEPVEIFIEFIKRSVFVLGVVSLLAAIGFLFMPKLLLKVNKILSKSISTEAIDRRLEKVHTVDEAVMKFRVLVGLVFLLIALIILVHCYFIFAG